MPDRIPHIAHAADLPDGTVVIDGNTTVFIRNHPTRFAPWRHTGGGFSADWQVDEALRRGAHAVLPELVVAARAALEALEQAPCQFWACPGPDVPPEDMKTCYVCAAIQDLRAALAGTARP